MEFIKMDTIENFTKGLNILYNDPANLLIYSDKGIMSNILTDSKSVIAIDNIIGAFLDNDIMDKYTLFVLISGLIRFYLINNIDSYDEESKIDNLFSLLKRASLHNSNDDINNVKDIFLSLDLDNKNNRKRL